ARYRRARADASAQGRPWHSRHHHHRRDRLRDEGRPGQGARGGLRRLHHQTDRHPRVARHHRAPSREAGGDVMTRKIMVVEDNAATRRMVRNALVRHGHEVIEAPDGETALMLMKREQPSVILQDLMLPDADGFELVGELRRLARGTDVSILAFSGFVSELEEARISTVGFDDIIAKPIAPSRIVPLIEAHLPGPAPDKAQFGAGRRLLIADDDAMRRRAPDVVISDVMMPELDGFGLAMALRQDPALTKVPVLLVTSSYVDP